MLLVKCKQLHCNALNSLLSNDNSDLKSSNLHIVHNVAALYCPFLFSATS